MPNRLLLIPCAIAVALAAAACGSSPTTDSVSAGSPVGSETPGYEPSDVRPVDSRPPDSSGGSGSGPEAVMEAWGVAAGERTPVGGSTPEGQRCSGFVNWDVIAGADGYGPPISPIYAEPGPSSNKGTIVGYWGIGLGWAELDDYLDPSFDYEKMLAEERVAEAAAMANSGGS